TQCSHEQECRHQWGRSLYIASTKCQEDGKDAGHPFLWQSVHHLEGGSKPAISGDDCYPILSSQEAVRSVSRRGVASHRVPNTTVPAIPVHCCLLRVAQLLHFHLS